MIYGQRYDPFLDVYSFHKNNLEPRPGNLNEYQNIQGSPYLNSQFVEGVIYLMDTSAYKLPLRYNIYTDEMQYLLNGVIYIVGNPGSLKRIELEGSLFIYLPSVPKSGYYELLQTGKCFLIQKRTVSFTPAEGPKPIVGTETPAKFRRDDNIFYLILNDSPPVEITNMKSVLTALQDQKSAIEKYIQTEKIKNPRRENLIKIAAYYNSL